MSRALVLVHGIFSSGKTWDSLKKSIAADEQLASLLVTTFEYSSPRFRFSPTRVIPDYDDIALKLWTFLQSKLSDYKKIAIIAHSQGGLIVQRMLAHQIEAGSAQSLARIQQIILLACPNSGSDLFLALRRYAFLWRHPQERALRPLDKALERTRSTVLEKVIHAREVTSTTCPIIIHAYAGETDGIVKSQSAISAFTSAGVLEGDHSSILDMALCNSGRETFIALSSQVDECWSLAVQSRIYASMGSEDEAVAVLSAAKSLARELGREDYFVDQFLKDAGPDVR